MKFEVALLGSPSLTVSMVSVDVKQHHDSNCQCETGGGRPGSPSLTVPTVSVDVKQHHGLSVSRVES